MKIKSLKVDFTIEKIIFLIGCLCLVSITALDILDSDFKILEEGWPDFSVRYIFRSIIIFTSILALFWSLIGHRRPKVVISESNGVSLEQVVILMVLFISVILLFIFIFKPSTFNAISKEDNIIEWGSSLLLFGSCFITAFSYLKNYHVLKNSKLIRLSLGLLSLAFIIMAMEEVSWFQRELQIETPKLFESNSQKEMNLHNFATNFFENLFYFGAFVFLVVFPFIRFLLPSITNNNYLKTFLPRPFIGVIGSIACAYNFDMWNIIFTQIAFFGSLMILCVFAIFSSVRNERYIILFTILLITTSQILFLVNGINFEYLWEITEYKEFLIALALFIYSWDIFIRIPGSFSFKRIEQMHVL
jgi:hypothetical protein